MTLVTTHDFVAFLAKVLVAEDGIALEGASIILIPDSWPKTLNGFRIWLETPMDPFFQVIGDCRQMTSECLYRLVVDWEHALLGLLAMERSCETRQSAYATAVQTWRRFGASKSAWDQVLKQLVPDFMDSFTCHSLRCPLHEESGGSSIGETEMLRCASCGEVRPSVPSALST